MLVTIRPMLAKLIALEGADKMGKATQSRQLAHVLRRWGDRVKLVEVPVNDGITYRLIYWMLRNGAARRYPNAFQFAMFVNKFVFQATKMLWYRLTNEFIVLDRWSLSGFVYGEAAGVNYVLNVLMYMLLVKPHMTIVIDGLPLSRKEEQDDVHERDDKLQATVRELYRLWVSLNPENHAIVDNSGGRDAVHERITGALLDEFDERDIPMLSFHATTLRYTRELSAQHPEGSQHDKV